MKVGKNKLLQKILIVMLTTLIAFNFIMPTVVIATDAEDDVNNGGSLADPIRSFLVWLGDSAMGLMQNIFYGSDDVVDRKLSDELVTEWGGLIQYYKYVYVPMYMISPESIFANKIPAFDINFFEPGEDVTNTFDIEELQVLKDYVESACTKDAYGNITSIDQLKADQLKSEVREELEKLEGKNNELDSLIYDAKSKVNGEWVGQGEGYIYYPSAGTSVLAVIKYIEQNEILGTTLATKESSAKILQSTVAYWYNALRNVAIIGLLSVLVYIGIRIVLSSAAADKSKYKEMLKDWVVAICLLFFMHYFMSFAVTITQSVTEALINDPSETQIHIQEQTGVEYTGDQLIGDVRIRAQFGNIGQQMSYVIIYLVIVVYTAVFAVMYLKRVLYMAFFTMMAPLVALTYPLDKARDGKAQAFDMWMKEYTFNLLIQPFHLIIYYVVVQSAMDLAVENQIYALVAIGFMIPAEKLLRKFFGFTKSETSGVLGGALGGAMLMQGINALKRKAGSSGGKGGSSTSGGTKEKNDKPPKISGRNINEIIDSETGNVNSDSGLGLGSGLGSGLDPIDEKFKDDPIYKSKQEKLDFLKMEGFGEDSKKYKRAKANLERYKTKDDRKRLAKARTLTGARWVSKGLKAGGKLAVRGTAATTLAALGVVGGLASDDYSNVAKFGLGGLMAGDAIAQSGINKIQKLPSDAYRIKQAYEEEREKFEQMAYTKEQRKQMAISRAQEEFINNKENQRIFKDAFENEQERKMAMEASARYVEYGIDDAQTMVKAMKLKTKGLGSYDDNKRIIIASKAPKLGMKDVEEEGKRLRERGFGNKAEIMKQGIREFNDWT